MSTSKDHFNIKGKNAESLVHFLALKTFFTDWCYLNPRLPDGKELCDLLVVFDEIAIVWQVKDLKIHEEGKYRKSEVDRNLRQLAGAYRQLFDLNAPIELENPRRGKELFDPTLVKEVYLISGLLGEREDYFVFAESVKGHMVHVFTREFTQIILTELDTISDFTNYLRAKEAFLKSKISVRLVGGEEELLAVYTMDNRSFKRFREANSIVIERGSWIQIQYSQEYKAKKEADKISYGWDSIIDRVHEGSPEYEKVARELARPSRFLRRYLSKVYFDAAVQAHEDNKHDSFRRVLPGDGVTYCFVFQDDPEPRKNRIAHLLATCWIARGKFQHNKKVIGIATENKIRPTCSYDFCVLDIPEWTEENQKYMEQLQQETKILANPIVGYTKEEEYPKLTEG